MGDSSWDLMMQTTTGSSWTLKKRHHEDPGQDLQLLGIIEDGWVSFNAADAECRIGKNALCSSQKSWLDYATKARLGLLK